MFFRRPLGWDMQYQSDWFQLYRRAVLEADPFRVNDRVDAASRCIQERLADQKIDPAERTERTVPEISVPVASRRVQTCFLNGNYAVNRNGRGARCLCVFLLLTITKS